MRILRSNILRRLTSASGPNLPMRGFPIHVGITSDSGHWNDTRCHKFRSRLKRCFTLSAIDGASVD